MLLIDALCCADESSDAVMVNGRSETLNHNNVAACGNGRISNNGATSDTSNYDPEVGSISALLKDIE